MSTGLIRSFTTKIAGFDGNGELILDLVALKRVLQNPKCANCYVGIYSVAGPFRTGKSFLLNLFYHYMQKLNTSRNNYQAMHYNISNVFFSQSGPSTVTSGIDILTEPIIYRQNNGNDVAIFLMDTQGLFDNKISKRNETVLGMLSFLLSSTVSFNIQNRIDSTHLQHIYKFAEKAKDYLKNSGQRTTMEICNHLLFVLRDYEDDEFALGVSGGKQYMNEILYQTQEQAREHHMTRNSLSRMFDISCSLLPWPTECGLKNPCCPVLSLLPEFYETAFELFDYLLSFKYLKKFQGRHVTCSELFDRVESYCLHNTFSGGEESAIMIDSESAMSNLISSHAGYFLKQVSSVIQRVNNVYQRRREISQIYHNTMVSFANSRPRWIRDISKWEGELQNIIHQCSTAVEACADAETTYIQTLDEFRNWLSEAARKCSTTFLPKEFANKKMAQLAHRLLDNVNSEIASQCCKYFIKHAQKVLVDTERDVADFVQTMRRNRFRNIILDVGMFFKGVGKAIGGGISSLWSDLGHQRRNQGLEDVRAGLKGANRNRSYNRTGELFSVPRENMLLEHYAGGQICFTLCFGEVSFPLQSRYKINW